MKSDATCLKRKADGNAGIQRFGVNTVEHPHQSLNREGCRGTIDDFATSFLHFSLFSTALWDLPNSRPIHSLMLSSYLFPCLPCLLPPFIVPCKGGGWSDLMNGKQDHTAAVCVSPIAYWILPRTSSLVTWSLYEMRSILRWHLISTVCILIWSSAVRVHDSQAYRKMDVTRERIRRILAPPSGKEKNPRSFRPPLRLHPAHMESGLCFFRVSSFCRGCLRFRAPAATRTWILRL